jgi:UTP--glucose-1-phosphate uridylyltransferase
MNRIEKAVIPAAGFGKRLLPATMIIPKELIPVGREPMLLRALREVVEAGVRHVAVIVNKRDDLVERFLSGTPIREIAGERDVEAARTIISNLDITLIPQPEPKGLGDALARARDFVRDEPFAVLLPDNVFFGARSPLAQLVPVFESHQKNVTGLIRVNAEDAPSFGNCGSVKLEEIGVGEYRVLEVGEKNPGFFSQESATDVIRWYARHIFLPSFFDYLERYRVEINNEVDDVPVLQAIAADEGIIGKLLDGRGYDVGNERGLVAAQRFLWEEVSSTWS